jgi:hypothetical protein
MVNWLATLVKFPAEVGQMGWQSSGNRRAISTKLFRTSLPDNADMA